MQKGTLSMVRGLSDWSMTQPYLFKSKMFLPRTEIFYKGIKRIHIEYVLKFTSR